jgi:hypothetical protein
MRRHFARIGLWKRLFRITSAALPLVLLLAGCGEGGKESDAADFECTEARAGWEKCTGGKVQWCHVLEGMEPHFHWGADCAAQGLTCVAGAAHEAYCVDLEQPCAAGEARCAENVAYTCVDGHQAVTVCGTAATCRAQDSTAFCVGHDECGGHGYLADGQCVCDRFYVQDPDDAKVCVAELSFPAQACQMYAEDPVEEKAVTSVFAEVFAPAHHADLDAIVEVDLAGGDQSFIHFPVVESGDYVVFFDTTGVFDGALDRNETPLAAEAGGSNLECPEVWVDHHHISVTYDGEGGDPVPAVLRFDSESAQTVRFLIRLAAHE